MKETIHRWCVENPRMMDAAYALVLGSSVFFEFSTTDVGGATAGP